MDKQQDDDSNDTGHVAHAAQGPQGIITQSPSVPPDLLDSRQLHALFDILTHHETYAEAESFKHPETISGYGYPFSQRTAEATNKPSYAAESVAPLLAGLLRSVVLSCPGVRDLPADFWYVRFQGILERLAEAELSESYDKGAVGTRKTLATAASAIHELVSRGLLGGLRPGDLGTFQKEYDRSKAGDLARAWEDAVQELVYGNLVEELFACAAEKGNLEEHSPRVQAAADYIILHLATLMHHVFVLSPEGPYLMKLLESVHKLLPYSMVKQTLRIGNAATMLSGMMRLMLSKMGVGAISNWIGLTQNADDGMNLLQRIIWLVLSWDASEIRKTAEGIEKAKGESTPSKEQLATIREYTKKPRKEHDNTRQESMDNTQSMVATILERSNPGTSSSISDTQHTQCSEYLSALLAARDRDEIVNALCRQNPDLLTQAIKDAVAAFEPMIRTIHQRVDLREQVSAAEGFIAEFIKVSKLKADSSGFSGGGHGTPGANVPSVEDYVLLLRNNRHLVYNWIHQLASKCPELRDEFCAWAVETIKVFRQKEHPQISHTPKPETTPNKQQQRSGAAGALSTDLQHLFASLPPPTQSRILPAIDAHATYLSTLESLSLSRMQRILDNLKDAAHAQQPPSSDLQPPSTSSYLSRAYWSGRSTPSSTRPSTPNPNPPSQPQSNSAQRSFSGPGMYLARWQQLLDDTLISPAVPRGGPIRKGRDVSGVVVKGKGVGSGVGVGVGVGGGGDTSTVTVGSNSKTGAGGPDLALQSGSGEAEGEEMEGRPSDVGGVVEAMGEGFRVLVGRSLVAGDGGNGQKG